MSEIAVPKDQYLRELARKAAERIAKGTTPATVAIMVPVWEEIIFEELKPILGLI